MMYLSQPNWLGEDGIVRVYGVVDTSQIGACQGICSSQSRYWVAALRTDCHAMAAVVAAVSKATCLISPPPDQVFGWSFLPSAGRHPHPRPPARALPPAAPGRGPAPRAQG